jgi:hypothetical protein
MYASPLILPAGSFCLPCIDVHWLISMHAEPNPISHLHQESGLGVPSFTMTLLILFLLPSSWTHHCFCFLHTINTYYQNLYQTQVTCMRRRRGEQEDHSPWGGSRSLPSPMLRRMVAAGPGDCFVNIWNCLGGLVQNIGITIQIRGLMRINTYGCSCFCCLCYKSTSNANSDYKFNGQLTSQITKITPTSSKNWRWQSNQAHVHNQNDQSKNRLHQTITHIQILQWSCPSGDAPARRDAKTCING